MATIKTVKDMHAECSLKLWNLNSSYMAMSDCCKRPATAAVIMPSGVRMWRCEAHKAWETVDSRDGFYVREVIVAEPVSV